MADYVTKIEDLIIPEVMADMISAKLEKKLVISKIAKIDTTLQGQPGNEVTVPQYKYIGDASDVAEGEGIDTAKLETGSTSFTIKKAGKGVSITDEAILSGYGDPVGESTSQLSLAMANKIDNDVVEVLVTPEEKSGETVTKAGVQLIYNPSTLSTIKYAGVVDAVDLFDEEVSSDKVMYIHPKQLTQLRKDVDFLSADKYEGGVMLNGEVGRIAGVRVVRSKKVLVVTVGSTKCYACPIVKLNNDAETEDDAPAVKIYLKRDTQVERERKAKYGTTEIYANKHYGVALTNTSKVVLAYFKQA